MATTSDYLKLHFIVFLWGFTAILGKLITLPPVEMVLYRTFIAAVGVAGIMILRKHRFKINPGDILRLALTGFIVAIHWITFFGSARVANVSVSLVGFATASLWTAFLEPLSHRKKIKGFEVMLGLFVIVGIFIIFSFEYSYRVGFMVGILSGLMAAVFSVINAKMIQRVGAVTITFYEMSGAFLGILLFLPFYKSYWATDGVLQLNASWLDWIYISVLAIVCTVYAFSVMVELMQRISVFFIQLTINLEPLYGILMAILIFKDKEKMNVNFYIGAIIILSAVLLYPLLKRKFDKKIHS